jgi:hypothetical protein
LRNSSLILALIGSLLPLKLYSLGTASLTNPDSSAYPLGFSFSAERDEPFSQPSGQGGGNYMMLLGLRYTITSSLSFDLKFLTGTEHHAQPVNPSLQADDRYSSGGVRIGIESRIFPEKLFHPVFSAGYDRVTILQNGSGYNGNGIILHAGYEYLHPSGYFSLQLNVLYQVHYYQPYDASSIMNIDTYTQHEFGISLSLLIHFHQGL